MLASNEFFGLHMAPGTGRFTLEEDKQRIAPVLQRMVQRKLEAYLEGGELHHYRFLFNIHWRYLQGLEIQSKSLSTAEFLEPWRLREAFS